MYPMDRSYTKQHEWVRFEGDVATIGITDFAQQELGDIVFVELPAVGKNLGSGESFGTIESVKAASDIYAPIGGVVLEVNSALGDSPEMVNRDPHDTGWLCKVRFSGSPKSDDLLDAAAYQKLVG